MERFRQSLMATVEGIIGQHDQADIYLDPAGDAGLVGPGSMSWEIHSDMGSVALAGLGSIIMEILHPAVMAGVHDQSSYQADPFRRARTTFGYVVVTTFGSTTAAEGLIERVRRIHGRVNGTMPDGRPYQALDPTLISWVHTAIPWGVMQMFDRYNRPLSTAEKNRYLAEQAVIGRLGGAGDLPVTVDELHDYVQAMRPQLAVNEQTRGFLDFLVGSVDGPARATPWDEFNRRLAVHASMSLMPDWARRMTGFHHGELAQRLYFEPVIRTQTRLLRWAFGTPAYRRLADQRVAGIASRQAVPAA